MTVYELIKSRRSVRSFKPQPVPEEVLRRMVDAARLAPSGANLQPLRYLVITDPAKRAEVFAHLKWAAYIQPAGDPAPGHEPMAYVIVLVDERTANKTIYRYDVGHATENLLLAGLAEGVAGCLLLAFDPRKVVESFGLPEYLRPDIVVALGYPDETPVFVDRSDTVKYWRDEKGVHIVPKRPLAEVMFLNGLPPEKKDEGPKAG